MAVNILGKGSTAHIGFFEQGKNTPLDEELVVSLDRQMQQKEEHLLRMPQTLNNREKIEALHHARNGVRGVIGAPLLPELPSQQTQQEDEQDLGATQRPT